MLDRDAVDVPGLVEPSYRGGAEDAELAAVGEAGAGLGHVEHFFCPVGPVQEDRCDAHMTFYTFPSAMQTTPLRRLLVSDPRFCEQRDLVGTSGAVP